MQVSGCQPGAIEMIAIKLNEVKKMAVNEALLAKVRAKMAQKAAKKEGKKGGKEGFFNLTDEFANTEKGVYENEARILPTSLDPAENDPFRMVPIHFNIGNVPFVCPKHFGEDKECGACDAQSDLWDIVRATESKKGEPAYELAKSFYSSDRYYSPVIRRKNGKVAEGYTPEWFAYSEKKNDDLFKWFTNERVGDFTDPETGRDLFITKKTKDAEGVKNQYGTVDMELDPAGTSKLGTKKQVQELIDNIPDLMSLLEVWDNDKINEVVTTHLASTASDDGGTSETKFTKKETSNDVDDAFADLKNE